MKGLIKYQRLTLWWALFMLIICSIKLGKVSESPMFFPGFDKLVHCGLLFVLTILCANGAIRQQNGQQLSYTQGIGITVITIGYGALIEILQLYVFTWRDGNWDDLFADAVGACMASLGVLIIQRAIYAKN